MTAVPDCFKAYDIRGRVPEDLDADLAHRIGRAFAARTGARRVCVGRDVRTSSEELCAAVAAGLSAAVAAAEIRPPKRQSTSPSSRQRTGVRGSM